MTFKNLYIEHERSSEAEDWVKEEIAEQEARFAEIEASMEALAPTREKWYQEFFDRIKTNGFNLDGDDKMPIPDADLPIKTADRKDQVVWKYGVDSDDTPRNGQEAKSWHDHILNPSVIEIRTLNPCDCSALERACTTKC